MFIGTTLRYAARSFNVNRRRAYIRGPPFEKAHSDIDSTSEKSGKPNMPYEYIRNNGVVFNDCSNGFGGDRDYHVVDIRSDTVSKPTQEMRDAMAVANVGDDVYEEDPTVWLLIRKSCELLGKEDGVFLPSGTMANLISSRWLLTGCGERFLERLL